MPLPLSALRLSEGKDCLQAMPSMSNENEVKGRGIKVVLSKAVY